jgi:hypothetical protein
MRLLFFQKRLPTSSLMDGVSIIYGVHMYDWRLVMLMIDDAWW